MFKRLAHLLFSWRLTFMVGSWTFGKAMYLLFCRDFRSAGFSLILSLVWLCCAYLDLRETIREEREMDEAGFWYLVEREAKPPESETNPLPPHDEDRIARRW